MKFTAKMISDHETRMNALYGELHRAFAASRRGDKKEVLAWKTAAESCHAYSSPVDELWSAETANEARSGNREVIENIILYLEINPFYFRSGYLKETLIRVIKSAPRIERDNLRLRNVVWNHLTGPNRREFRSYCSLARAVCDSDFFSRLERISPELNQRAKGKFSTLLERLTQSQTQFLLS